jgi:hypothetical protein
MNEALLVRYRRVMRRIGGADGLLNLPSQVRRVLGDTNDLAVKVKMLEAIADAMKK